MERKPKHNLCEPIYRKYLERLRERESRRAVAAEAELQQQNAVFAWRARAWTCAIAKIVSFTVHCTRRQATVTAI